MIFIVNGFTTSAFLPRLFEIQQRLNLTDGQLGAALSAGAVGGLAIGPLAAPLIARWGSARVAVACTLLLVPVLPVLGIAPSWAILALTIAWIGATDSVLDASMNANGLRVQVLYRRSILNGMHGYWSLGTVIGGILGSITLALQVPLTTLLIGVAIIGVIAIASTARWLLPGPDPISHAGTAESTRPLRWSWIIVALGVFTLLAIAVEDVPARWSSIYLASIDTPEALLGTGFVAFTIAMTIGRFTGDRLVDTFGDVRVVQVGMAAAAITLSAALLVATVWAFIVASLVIGFAVATLFPAAMRSAAHIPGIRPATGVAIVSWIARGGFVLAPIIVGTVADSFGIAWGLMVPVVAAVLLIAIAPVVADRRTE
jgi:MFS family permease